MANPNRKDWSRHLKDALWAHRTAYRTPSGIQAMQYDLRPSWQRKEALVARIGGALLRSILKLNAIELKDETTNSTFQVNGHQVKIFHESSAPTIGCMTRSSSNPLHELDLKIKITVRRLRKVRSTLVSSGSSFSSNFYNSNCVTNDSNSFKYSSANNSAEPKQMENNDQTLKELAMLDVYPQLEPALTYELKSNLLHLLPKFHGLAGEDPHKHLK
ncbi:hypothetical protein CR513_16932, partial [Mucuna pruriens]